MFSVQTNMLAMNAARQFGINEKKRAKNTEKLSSGYQINRSADDAAGLSISEKMRRQIRGLRMGETNIVDGISCVQIAKGSLNEICDMLHRINELSVKAYNGTNQEEDRKYIQEEINQLIDEIGRTADATTFNEIPLLKGDPHTEKVQVEILETTTETRSDIYTDLPKWLKDNVDERLELHNAYDAAGTQDTTDYMLQSVTLPNGSKGYHYYGPPDRPGMQTGDMITVLVGGETIEAVYQKPWTEAIDNNPTAKIDFEGLIDASPDAQTLYDNMFELLGGCIGVPCGTCNEEYYGVGFTGNEKGYLADPISFFGDDMENPDKPGERIPRKAVRPKETINLSEWREFASETDPGRKLNCFDRITEMIERHKNSKQTDSEKKAEVKALAEEIAQKLCRETYEKAKSNTENQDHFDRALLYGDYSLIVYDYRDNEALTHLQAADSKVYTSCRCYTKTVTQRTFFVDGFQKVPLEIQASEKSGDRIPILLPVISEETLGIQSYDISRYTEKATYSESYYKKLEKYQEAYREYEEEYKKYKKEYDEIMKEYENNELAKYNAEYKAWLSNCPKQTTTYEYEVQVRDGFDFQNGEKKPKYKTDKRTETITTTVTNDPGNPPPVKPPLPKDLPKPPQKPQMFEIEEGDMEYRRVYDPDNNKTIDDALEYVLRCRTVLGATQNRLEHAYNIDANSEENTTAAESRIRDTDIAKEMVDFSSNNILLQAGVSMMTHANQDRQSVLRLLQ